MKLFTFTGTSSRRNFSALIFLLSTGLFVKAQSFDFQWAQTLSSAAGGAQSKAICTDGSGNVYITGTFEADSVTFGGVTLYNVDASGATQDVFVVKYNSSGTVLWARSGGGNQEDQGLSIAADANGHVYITGYTQSPFIVFGNDTLTNTGTGETFFITKYDSSGNTIWVVGATNPGLIVVQANSISVDNSGNSYITGIFSSTTVVIGPDTLTNAGTQSYDAFTAKFDSSGNAIWANSIDGTSDEYGVAISTDGAGNSYITGTYESATISLGSNTLTNAGQQNIFVVKYDPSGNVLWANTAGGAALDGSSGAGIVVDASDNVYITGTYESPIATFGSISLHNGATLGGAQNLYLAKYNSSGTIQWAQTVGGDGYNGGYSLSADAAGNIYVGGHFFNTYIILGSITIENILGSIAVPEDNLVVAKYNASGDALWAINAGFPGNSELVAISSDASGNVYITGGFDDTTIIFGPDTLRYSGGSAFPANSYTAKVNNVAAGIATAPIAANDILMYPNPSIGQFYFKGITAGSILEVYDELGQNIISTIISPSGGGQGEESYLLNISGNARGIYFYRVMNNADMVQQGKMVIE